MTSSRERTRDYLVTYAAEHEWAELWPKVMAARAGLLGELVGVSEKQASWRPPDGEGEEAWSIAEVMQHVLTYTQNVVAIINGTARGLDVAKDPPGAINMRSERALDDLLREAVDLSSSLANIHQHLPARPNEDVTVAHVAFGSLNYRSWFLFLSWHDGAHMRQIVELKHTAGFPQE